MKERVYEQTPLPLHRSSESTQLSMPWPLEPSVEALLSLTIELSTANAQSCDSLILPWKERTERVQHWHYQKVDFIHSGIKRILLHRSTLTYLNLCNATNASISKKWSRYFWWTWSRNYILTPVFSQTHATLMVHCFILPYKNIF